MERIPAPRTMPMKLTSAPAPGEAAFTASLSFSAEKSSVRTSTLTVNLTSGHRREKRNFIALGHRSIVSGHGAVYGRADALNRGKSLVVFRIFGRKPGTQLPCRFHVCRNFNGFFVTV